MYPFDPSHGLVSSSTPIQPITGWPSLSPPSFTHRPFSVPCGSLSEWETFGLTTFRASTILRGLGPASPPEVHRLRRVSQQHPYLTSYLLVQAFRSSRESFSLFRLSHVTTFISGSLMLTLPRYPSSFPPRGWRSQLPLAVLLPSCVFGRLSELSRMRLHCRGGFAPHWHPCGWFSR